VYYTRAASTSTNPDPAAVAYWFERALWLALCNAFASL
jgi:hypothetical protein